MRTAFVNYRTGDVEYTAGSIATVLMDAMGEHEIFYAPQSIPLGDEFDVDILAEVRKCPVLLVVIGPHWLKTQGKHGGRKLDEPDDWVRREIAEGLSTCSRVVIILVDGAKMPTSEELPEEIVDLARRQYRRVSYRSVPQDNERLIGDLLKLPEFAHIALIGSERLDDWWAKWTRENPRFTTEVLFAAREQHAIELRTSLTQGPAEVKVCGGSREESLAFAAAALLPLAADVRVVTDQPAWDRYAQSQRNLILIAASKELDTTVASGHRVVLLGEAHDDGLHLPPVGLVEAIDAFVALGLSREEAMRYAARARREFPLLLRDLSRTGRSAPTTLSPDNTAVDQNALAAAVTRGPLRHLGLDAVESRASALLATNSTESAELYAEIVAVLLKNGFAIPAVEMRRALGHALTKMGDLNGAAEVALALFWEAATEGTHVLQSDLPVPDSRLNPGVARALAVALSCEKIFRGYTWLIDDPAARFDELVDGDPHRLDAAVFLAEHAIAARRGDVLVERLDVLTALANTRERQDSPEERLVARLGMCLAEITGQWVQLERRARREFAPWHAPWITARRARSLLMANELLLAKDAYEEAIADALVVGMIDEAADWLYALRVVRSRLGSLFVHGDDQHPLAQHLRPLGSPSRLPGSNAIEELAMRSVLTGKGPTALGRVSQWRWKAYVRAGVAGELDAAVQLGALLAANAEPVDGMHELVWAGARTKAVEVAKALPHATVIWSAQSVGSAAAQQSAALAAAAACADLLADDDVPGWIDFALDIMRNPQPSTPFDDLVRQAVGLLAALGQCLTEAQAEAVLDVTGSWSLRRSATLLVDIAEIHAALTERALDQLLDGLLHSEDYADVALGQKGAPLLRANAELVGAKFANTKDNHSAYLALAMTGHANDDVRAHAQERAKRIIARPEPQPGVMRLYAGYGDWPLLVDLLEPDVRAEFAASLLRHAEDSRDCAENRRTALEGLAMLAPGLAAEQQRALFEALRPFVRGERDANTSGWPLTGMRHPLSMLRFDLGPDTLADMAVFACSWLASTDEERRFVRDHAVRLLTGWVDVRVPVLVRSLERATENVHDLPLGHPDQHVHALAAVLWARRPENQDLGLNLANNPHRLVRASLAAALDERPEHRAVREILSRDACRSVRRLCAAAFERR
ncbi:hypothetical protein [Goodfellowiella coeruleoviolacea]|uniref:TIR domain-containing protein n=1 Tax=Goodfellowiella coeruleoviolacea TaxID=334858 RepID=A0AAE3GGU7_9PSEU|nr:hypothetical protein [Goodfellowiella coeruleoviolacea]MCP2167127.1 TIR domain-containing protein [Goodfellowiella coeruleoviolacea]